MKKHVVFVAVLLLALGVGSYAVAGGGRDRVKAKNMSGYFEGAPGGPVSSAATGDFEARINDAARTIHFELSYSGLEGDVRQAHIHFGQPDVNGGISLWLCETAANPRPVGSPDVPDCLQSGTIEFTLTADHVVGPAAQGIAAGEFEEIVAAIRAGRAYANVHSSKFPGGEVRGDINARGRGDDDDD